MFTVVAALVFSLSFVLALGVIAVMLIAYRHKMVAALLMEPQPELTPIPIYKVSVRSRRQGHDRAFVAARRTTSIAA